MWQKKSRRYILLFNPSIQHLVLDATHDFLNFIISCRIQDNYLTHPYTVPFRNKLQFQGPWTFTLPCVRLPMRRLWFFSWFQIIFAFSPASHIFTLCLKWYCHATHMQTLLSPLPRPPSSQTWFILYWAKTECSPCSSWTSQGNCYILNTYLDKQSLFFSFSQICKLWWAHHRDHTKYVNNNRVCCFSELLQTQMSATFKWNEL